MMMISIYTYICIDICASMCTYIYIYIYKLFMYIYIYMYTHVHVIRIVSIAKNLSVYNWGAERHTMATCWDPGRITDFFLFLNGRPDCREGIQQKGRRKPQKWGYLWDPWHIWIYVSASSYIARHRGYSAKKRMLNYWTRKESTNYQTAGLVNQQLTGFKPSRKGRLQAINNLT